ncbi:hypothetical protein [Microscilla marina]|uniref:Uncharacterized protein n=1 Tax=Microscilla marina ATCC 23134 TaxID=313606 RepID=A1ZLE7_MICM2|nr:hypothetical protein [Microscilla marina]EAY28701.1 hypothetical protein M23134_07799 [Microscilla marina ATCC 23134]
MSNTSPNTDDFINYQSFFSPQDAQPLLDFLAEFEVQYQLEEIPELLGQPLIGDHLRAKWLLRIARSDIDNVNELLSKAAEQINDVPKTHYLHKFTNPELRDIIKSPQEWNPQDVHFAKLLLKDRGKPYE